MSDLSIFAKRFDREIRNRGEDYFLHDKVKPISQVIGDKALFQVHGSEIYNVQVQFEDNQLITKCNCPYFINNQQCKHAWAAILKADQLRFISKSKQTLTSNKTAMLTNWKQKLQTLKKKSPIKIDSTEIKKTAANSRLAFFAIDQKQSVSLQKWVIRFYSQDRKKNGELTALKSCLVNHDQVLQFENSLDQKALWAMLGMPTQPLFRRFDPYFVDSRKELIFLYPHTMDHLLTELSLAHKLLLLDNESQVQTITFDENRYQIKLELEETQNDFVLKAHLHHGQKKLPIQSQQFYLSPYLIHEKLFVATDFDSYEEWYNLFKSESEILIPKGEINGFLDYFFQLPAAPTMDYPKSLQIKHIDQFSKVRLVLDADPSLGDIYGQIEFLYGETFISPDDSRSQIFSSTSRTVYYRNKKKELSAIQKLQALAEQISNDLSGFIEISENQVSSVVDKAFKLGWEVVAFKKPVNPSLDFKATVSSGVDWFDLHVNFQFQNGFKMSLPQLLQNLRNGEKFIALADGTTGLLREEWIQKFASLAKAGTAEGDAIRLTKIQALFYSTELTEDKNLKSDKKFKTFQKIIQDLNHLQDEPLDPQFQGKLRNYQKKGLAWLEQLSKNEIGSILADDMGLGKTIQILSLLSGKTKAKTLIVAPKSLVFNWINEGKKFTPHLIFHDHTGISRTAKKEQYDQAHIIVTTYQTLRNDIELFKKTVFDYFILDEAHSIKNAESQSHMACKLIQAKKKIALTGTPVENSLNDLFSILSVVTPGLISETLAKKYSNTMEPNEIQALSQSLRPFILRRTKDQVLKDLPKKSEQVLFCELSATERQKYNDLKNYYWNNLNSKFENKGFQNSKIDVLEALLRLRQASCHPGLLNKDLASESSAKFEILLEQLETILSEGHKVLIFSQFTSLLGLFGQALKAKQIQYEYLDGQTTDRAARVQNFQENKSVQVFLISLKAGGVGLNLTSADYVFILDPWWNPAAESQAIDRAHRIGQSKKVFAYKIIAKDTVEEKILALQEKKRALAGAVISNEKSFMTGLKLEDLKELFS